MWFEDLTGFVEVSPDQVRSQLVVSDNRIKSRVNGNTFVCGELQTPSLAELRSTPTQKQVAAGPIKVREVISDVTSLHLDPDNAGALFQVASQFNLLEMPSQHVGPERGVGVYEYDLTQGPACAVAAGAGTIYRCYMAEVNGKTGQSADSQIDCLEDMGKVLGNTDGRLWQMQNGYAMATSTGLSEISERIRTMSKHQRDFLRQKLRIGIQWDTQVTLDDCTHLVTQVYGSALPVGYSYHDSRSWEPFARLILNASYEATFWAALLNFARTGNNKVYLTLLGGGVFGNDEDWILTAIRRALELFARVPLDVAIVSYKASRPIVKHLIT
ncbi:MAG: hypothetical protein WBN41_14670 [Lysobacterales bacterium]